MKSIKIAAMLLLIICYVTLWIALIINTFNNLDFGKTLGQVAVMQLVVIVLGFIAELVLVGVYVHFIDSLDWSIATIFRWWITSVFIFLLTLLTVKGFVPITVTMISEWLKA